MQCAQENEHNVLKNITAQRIAAFKKLAHGEQDNVTKHAILNIAFYLEDGLSEPNSKEYFLTIQKVLNHNLSILQKTSLFLLKSARTVITQASSCLKTIDILQTPSLFNRHEH